MKESFEFNSLSEARSFIRGLKIARDRNLSFDEKDCKIYDRIGVTVVELEIHATPKDK